MVDRFRCAWILQALFLLQSSAFGQSVKEMQSATFERLPGTAAPPANTVNLTRAKAAILSSTNEFRRQQGRAELKPNPDLADAAQYFADYMARTDKYSHTADGKEPRGTLCRMFHVFRTSHGTISAIMRTDLFL